MTTNGGTVGQASVVSAGTGAAAGRGCLQKFRLFETRLKYYMVGRDKNRTQWRMLTIDRLELYELIIHEDPTIYSENECYDLLKQAEEENIFAGGLRYVTKCYGIAGFVKFLGPYYMLLITRRRKIGTICGHPIYAVSKSDMIMVPNSAVRSKMTYSKDENRYNRLLRTVDLRKDFFFSYSYNIMRSLQLNLCDGMTGPVLYETMFVWNEFLTRGVRDCLKSNTWIVALVYGFFKQAKLAVNGKDFWLTLIARRSRHFAGTRYLKRGVNNKGEVANDVEIEQIISEGTCEGIPSEITSVVQNRGSIPLFWSQKTSKLNIRPDIILHKDKKFEATQLHFQNLVTRYGNPIIILNLIKNQSHEKKPRESLLHAEFANAIDYINKNLPEEKHLKFFHWDIKNYARRKGANVLEFSVKVATCALGITGFFHFYITPALRTQAALKSPEPLSSKFQRGVLRTNCIDCLDRTNLAQYAYGLAALGHQLHTLGFINTLEVDLNSPLANNLMVFYERMGDALALQYGGSTAHNKIFSERRGQWKITTQSQKLLRIIQRFYSNAYMDVEKQDAINLFLGDYRPYEGKPELWEQETNQQHDARIHALGDQNTRSLIQSSLSDGSIQSESHMPVPCSDPEAKDVVGSALLQRVQQGSTVEGFCDSIPEISTCQSDIPSQHRYDGSNYSNFLDFDLLSSPGNFCEGKGSASSAIIDSRMGNHSTKNVTGGTIDKEIMNFTEEDPGVKDLTRSELKVEAKKKEPSVDAAESSRRVEFSDTFADWVAFGEILSYYKSKNSHHHPDQWQL